MSESRIRAEVRVTGVVQGVGFRPFVYRTAVGHGLAGSVKNTGDAGVEIVLEGASDDVSAFLDDLETDAPPLSVVESVEVDRTTPTGLEAFEIVQSTDSSGGSGTIPPDTGMCDNCLEDVRDPDSRYHDYWATSCVDCGPRFTVIRELPYDRPTTSMDAFPMCSDCRAEYTDPADRRYHAQTIACPECGPGLSLLDGDASPVVDGTGAIRATASRLRNGDVVGIKGIGGTHVACDATDPAAVRDLRERTGRPAKPFALMVSSLEQAEQFARLSAAEREALTDTRRPIVLLEVGDSTRDEDWLEAVSPGLHTVGVMLPYSGLHHLLFDHVDRPLVMTSGNLPGQPMALTGEAIFDQLGEVVDAALVHDREIVARCDDSVVRFVDGERHFVRRSRGWVPVGLPRPVPDDETAPEVLAVGAEFDAVAALTQGADVIPTQHVGDVDDPETVAYHQEAVSHLQALTGADPDLVACDRHPDFLTTREGERYAEAGLSGPVRVQHHHAHAASLLGEHGVDRAIVVAADGTGYGGDGTVWGGEVLDSTLESSDRVGGLGRFALPGGEAAVQRPARILAALLDDEERVTSLLVDTGTVDSAADDERRPVPRCSERHAGCGFSPALRGRTGDETRSAGGRGVAARPFGPVRVPRRHPRRGRAGTGQSAGRTRPRVPGRQRRRDRPGRARDRPGRRRGRGGPRTRHRRSRVLRWSRVQRRNLSDRPRGRRGGGSDVPAPPGRPAGRRRHRLRAGAGRDRPLAGLTGPPNRPPARWTDGREHAVETGAILVPALQGWA
jgi:hydrogenase maturation protein HypF